MRILVIGGGLFGCCSAITLSEAGYQVDLIEEAADIMQKASRLNHNRIHLGYHYLRSIETAEQSLEGLLSFMFNFGNSVVTQFPNYYALARDGSKTSTEEFTDFCDRVGIGYDESYPDEQYLDRSLLNSCFKVPEPVFDYSLIKGIVKSRLQKVNLKLNTKCCGLTRINSGLYEVEYDGSAHAYDIVINATYSSFNEVNSYLGIKPKKLLYEYVFIPTFKYQASPVGLTIMDGEFCSVMPRGMNQNEFILYHVDHSVANSSLTQYLPDFPEPVNIENRIYQESTYYMPFLNHVEYNGINKVIRTVHENSDDARLTELFTFEEFPNYFSILSGKVTTCFQVALELKHIIQNRKIKKRFKI